MSLKDVQSLSFSKAGLSTAVIVRPGDRTHLRVEFALKRTPPLCVFAEPALPAGQGIVVRGEADDRISRVWVATFVLPIVDDELRAAAREDHGIAMNASSEQEGEPPTVRLTWIPPADGGELISATFPEDVEALDHDIADMITAYERAKDELQSRDPNYGKKLAWLQVDLATSLPKGTEDEYKAVADLLDGGPSTTTLLARLDPLKREQVQIFLEARTRSRACLHVTGGSPAQLPDPGPLRETLEAAAVLVMQVLGRYRGGDVSSTILEFGAGLLRKPPANGVCLTRDGDRATMHDDLRHRMNIEPNSFAIVSFAELFDVVCDPSRSLLSEADIRLAREFRTWFIAMIQPFTTTYRHWHRDSRRADAYGNDNFYRPHWTETMLKAHAQEYDSLGPQALVGRWACDLFHALRDEQQVVDVIDQRRG